jgi:2,3-bisphosphoglycerate-independent phosphoglycerate mutase
MLNDDFQELVLRSLNTIIEQQTAILSLVSKADAPKSRKKQLTETQKAILAHGAVTIKGCETFAEVAKELGISRQAAYNSPGVRRVLGLEVADCSSRRGFVNADGQVDQFD